MNSNIHASSVILKDKGILITGASSSGKSDLCLRLIMEHKALLVADDRVNIKNEKHKIIASAPTILKGLLEVRGVGIIKLPFEEKTQIDLVVKLANKREEVERLPEEEYFEYGGIKIRQITLFSKDASCPAKILAAMTLL